MSGTLYACIMAGGTGTRFWPESTVNKPKQLLAIGTDKPLLNLTLERISKLVPHSRQYIITGNAIIDAVRESTPELPAENIISEPLRKNTAPCILLAAKWLYNQDPDAVMCVLPSDHLIEKPDEFLSILECARKLASEKDALITLGITTRYAETGYGYIEFDESAGEIQGRPFYRIASFREKPNLKTAERYFESGNFYWNSGMFVWSVRSILKALQTYMPAIYDAFSPLNDVDSMDELTEKIAEIYPGISGISIDYGVMEKANNIYGFPADIGWNDVGSWTSLEELLESDENGNVQQGTFIPIDSEGCIASSRGGLTVGIGVKDLIIVRTPKVTLVCDKHRAQEIKRIFNILESKGLDEYK